MKVQNRDVDIVQEFSMVLDGVAARKEDNNLLLHVLFEEGEEEEEASVGGADDITLREGRYRAGVLSLVNIDIQGSGS